MFLFGWGKSKPSPRKLPARKAPARVRLGLEALEDRLVPTTTATFNVAAGDTATLIADINTANSSGDVTTINLTQSTYDFTSANNNTFGPNALPDITGNITINGNGAVLMRDPSLGDSNPFRLIYVSGDEEATTSGGQSTGTAVGSLTLTNLTLEGGLAEGGESGTGGGGLGAGGAIFNQGNLTLNGVTVEQSTAEGGSSGHGLSTNGGGVTTTTASSTTSTGTFGVGGNGGGTGSGGAGGFGGGGGAGDKTGGAAGFGAGAGTASDGGGGLGAGGGIFNMYGTVTLINSTLADNVAQGGGNGAGYGGAIFNLDGTLNVISSTIADNEATAGGAVYNLSYGSTTSSTTTTQGVASTVNLTNSILADSLDSSSDLTNDENSSTSGAAVVNATEPNIVMVSSTIDDATTNGTPLTGNPELGPLMNNGGPTPTMALESGSAALGTGGAAPTVPTTDQRGDARGSVLDLGAYQSTLPGAATTTTTLTYTNGTNSSGTQTSTLTAVITSANGATPAGTVTFVDTTSGTTLGSASVSEVNGQAVATLTTTSLSAGGDTITATYASSNGFVGSTGTVIASAGTQVQEWLNDVYVLLLGRPIDPTGLTYWTAVLNSGTSAAIVVYDIETSIECEDDDIQAVYESLLGTAAPSSAVSYLQGLMSEGATLQSVEAVIAGSSTFYAATGDTDTDWLNAVYEDFLDVPADDLDTVSSSEETYLAMLASGYNTTDVMMSIMGTSEYLTDLVNQDYETYLGRAADTTSLSAYVSALEGGSTTNAQIVAELISSGEFTTYTGTAT